MHTSIIDRSSKNVWIIFYPPTKTWTLQLTPFSGRLGGRRRRRGQERDDGYDESGLTTTTGLQLQTSISGRGPSAKPRSVYAGGIEDIPIPNEFARLIAR